MGKRLAGGCHVSRVVQLHVRDLAADDGVIRHVLLKPELPDLLPGLRRAPERPLLFAKDERALDIPLRFYPLVDLGVARRASEERFRIRGCEIEIVRARVRGLLPLALLVQAEREVVVEGSGGDVAALVRRLVTLFVGGGHRVQHLEELGAAAVLGDGLLEVPALEVCVTGEFQPLTPLYLLVYGHGALIPAPGLDVVDGLLDDLLDERHGDTSGTRAAGECEVNSTREAAITLTISREAKG